MRFTPLVALHGQDSAKSSLKGVSEASIANCSGSLRNIREVAGFEFVTAGRKKLEVN
jgi:hypothetical protein